MLEIMLSETWFWCVEVSTCYGNYLLSYATDIPPICDYPWKTSSRCHKFCHIQMPVQQTWVAKRKHKAWAKSFPERKKLIGEVRAVFHWTGIFFFFPGKSWKCETKITPFMTKTHLPGRHFPLPTTLGAGPTARDRHVVVLLGPKCRGSTDDVLKITLFFLVGRFFEGDSENLQNILLRVKIGRLRMIPKLELTYTSDI